MLIRVSIVFIYASVLLMASLATISSSSSISHIDKVIHLGAYCLFMLIAYFPSITINKNIGMGCSIFAYGVLIEILQDMVGRDFSYADMVANGVGVLIGFILAKRYFSAVSY